MTGWPDDRMTAWKNDRMNRWQDDWMTGWPDDQMTIRWLDDGKLGRRLTVWYTDSQLLRVNCTHNLLATSFIFLHWKLFWGHLFNFYLSSTIANRSDRNIAPWKFTQWVWCLFVSWQYSFSSSHPGPAQQEVKQARPSPLHNSPAVRIMRQKLSHTLFILTRYKHWQAAAAGD